MAHIEESLRKLLNKIAKEQNYDNPEIIINETSSGGANYTSKLFTVIIKADNKEDLHLFAKFAMLGEAFRGDVSTNVFNTERFAYMELSKIYAALEEENGVPEEHRLHFTKFYGYDPSLYQEIIVLENLLTQGFVPFDRFKSIDWEYASSAITEVAKLHALSFAFSKKDPEEFKKVISTVLKLEMKEGMMDSMLQNAKELALKHIKPEYKEVLEKFLDKYMSDVFMKLSAPVRSVVIMHSDFRGSNLVHRVRKDGKVDIKILDLQTLQGGCAVSDLIYFIFSGSDQEFRDKYYEKLVEHYYTQLCASMKRLHLDPEELFSRKDFEYEFNEKLPYGLALAVMGLPVITVEAENAPTIGEDMANFAIEKTGDRYPQRINEIVSDFVKWGILK